jgi:DeoR family transcriptional regulator of aga operon
MVCTKFFLGVDGFDPDFGITTSTIEEAHLSRKMMAAAAKVIVVADSSKFGHHGFGRVATIDEVDVIITDVGLSPEWVKIIEEAGIELITV